MMDISEMLVLMGFVGACFLAAATGAAFPPGDWYERLAKPPWRPPNWLFGPAWAILYLTIAVSGWLVWRTAGLAGAALPLAIYLVQLVLNAAWTPIFFGLHRPDLAFIEIVVLWLSIVATMAAFHPVNAAAAWLLLPYLLWVTFAAALNFTVWRLNRGAASQSASVRTLSTSYDDHCAPNDARQSPTVMSPMGPQADITGPRPGPSTKRRLHPRGS